MAVSGGTPGLLRLVGLEGRWSVIQVLRAGPGAWTLRGLAAQAGVSHTTAGRTVRALERFGAVETTRPGRAAVIVWRPDAPAATWLAGLDPPDLDAMVRDAFEAGLRRGWNGPPPRVLLWRDPAFPIDQRPMLAVVARDEEQAMDAVGPGLDAVQGAMLPVPWVTTLGPQALDGDDAVGAALRHALGRVHGGA